MCFLEELPPIMGKGKPLDYTRSQVHWRKSLALWFKYAIIIWYIIYAVFIILFNRVSGCQRTTL